MGRMRTKEFRALTAVPLCSKAVIGGQRPPLADGNSDSSPATQRPKALGSRPVQQPIRSLSSAMSSIRTSYEDGLGLPW
jgi:hypothetical protein